MMLTATRPRPSAVAFAARISRSSAVRLAASTDGLSPLRDAAIRSGWWRRRSTLEIVPTAPSRATAPASLCAEMPTPMPPCTIGSTRRPRTASSGNAGAAADAEAAAVYAEALGRDPGFYSFVKTLDIYKETMDKNTSLILSTDSEFLQYFKDYGYSGYNRQK